MKRHYLSESLKREWDYEKNKKLLPDMFTSGSNKKVWWKCKSCGLTWEATINHRSQGRGCPYCSGKKIHVGFNDLSTTNSQLASEWDYDLNENLTPDMYTKSSHKKVWWKCENCGYSWEATIASRNSGRGCPICNGSTVKIGYNDLKTTNVQLVSEWNYEKNNGLVPEMFTSGSNEKVWWKCSNCGYSWEASINSRNSGSGCPVCVNQKVVKGYNDLESLRPDIAKYWDYEKNGSLTPDQVTVYSNREVYWICENGHSTLVSVYNKSSSYGCSCSICQNKFKNKSHLV